MGDQGGSNNELQVYMDLLRENMPQLKENYQVETLAIFGSYLHENQGEESDLDLLVEFHKTPHYFSLSDWRII